MYRNLTLWCFAELPGHFGPATLIYSDTPENLRVFTDRILL
jgi:hypothetical protein